MAMQMFVLNTFLFPSTPVTPVASFSHSATYEVSTVKIRLHQKNVRKETLDQKEQQGTQDSNKKKESKFQPSKWSPFWSNLFWLTKLFAKTWREPCWWEMPKKLIGCSRCISNLRTKNTYLTLRKWPLLSEHQTRANNKSKKTQQNVQK